MQLHEIENWVYKVVDQVNTKQPNEDARVELKADWPESPNDAARRIAGHANASFGAPVLWIIGLHEKKGVLGVEHKELSAWWSQVQAEFDGITPQLQDINIRIDDKTISALLFETERRPFVVKNAVFRKPGAGPVRFEVPWREGTSVRSANRSELIRLLSPLQQVPKLELLKGTLSCAENFDPSKDELEWDMALRIYAEVPPGQTVVIPNHRCSVSFEVRGCVPSTQTQLLKLGSENSPMIRSSGSGIIVDGPGVLTIFARTITQYFKGIYSNPAQITVTLFVSGCEYRASLTKTLPRFANTSLVGKWEFKNEFAASRECYVV